MPDAWDDAAAHYHAAPAPGVASSSATPGNDDWKLWTQNDAADSGDSQSSPIGNAASHAWNQISSIPGGIANAVMHPIDTATSMYQQQKQLAGEGIDAAKKGDYALAAARGVETLMPGVGPSIASGFKEIKSGDTSGGIGDIVGSVGPTLAAPYAAKALGKGLKSAAAPVAEGAMGINYMDRAYGKTPGQGILEETKGIRPATIESSARARMGQLNTELENAAAKSTTPASLQPARDVIAKRAATAAAGNSASTPAELSEMSGQLTTPNPGFAGVVDPSTGQIAVDQSPANILRMKREFGKDFTRWNPLNPKGEMGTARQAYRALDQELDRTVPGADQLNQRISSLIPVADRAQTADLKAGIGQNVMHRIGAHTGALVGAAAGYHAAGPMGGLAGLVVPEVLASPTVRMAGARSLYGAGQAAASPVGQAAATGATAGAISQSDTVAQRMGRAIAQGQQGQQ